MVQETKMSWVSWERLLRSNLKFGVLFKLLFFFLKSKMKSHYKVLEGTKHKCLELMSGGSGLFSTCPPFLSGSSLYKIKTTVPSWVSSRGKKNSCTQASVVEQQWKFKGCICKWKGTLAEHLTSIRQLFKAVLDYCYFLIPINAPGELRMWLQPQLRNSVSVRS